MRFVGLHIAAISFLLLLFTVKRQSWPRGSVRVRHVVVSRIAADMVRVIFDVDGWIHPINGNGITRPQTVTHLSTNRTRRRATTLNET